MSCKIALLILAGFSQCLGPASQDESIDSWCEVFCLPAELAQVCSPGGRTEVQAGYVGAIEFAGLLDA